MVIVVLCVATGLPLLLLAWSKIIQLLNSQSDAGVLLGLTILITLLASAGLSVYFLLRMLTRGQATNDRRDEAEKTQSEMEQPRSLFSENNNSVEQSYEDRRTKIRRE